MCKALFIEVFCTDGIVRVVTFVLMFLDLKSGQMQEVTGIKGEF